MLVLSLSGFCGYTTLVPSAPFFQFSQRAALAATVPVAAWGIRNSYAMQSASAAHREAHSALLVGAAVVSKSL